MGTDITEMCSRCFESSDERSLTRSSCDDRRDPGTALSARSLSGGGGATQPVSCRLIRELCFRRDAVSELPLAVWAPLQKDVKARGTEYAAYPPDPTVRAVTAAFLEPLVAPTSTLEGLEHLDAAWDRVKAGGRVILVGNHTSYADTTTAAHLLRRTGRCDVADAIAVIAGPKVFSDPFRRFASAATTSIEVAQSSRIAHNEAALSPRDVARIARRCLDIAADLMDRQHIVLLYAEGTRSRDRRLQPFLKATARYLTLPDTLVLPLSQTGACDVMPVGQRLFHCAPVGLRFGPMIDPSGRTRVEVLEAVHRAIADGLPEAYRPPPEAVPSA